MRTASSIAPGPSRLPDLPQNTRETAPGGQRSADTLNQSEAQYRLVVENAHDGIFVAQDGIIKLSNPRLQAMLGYTQEELQTRPFAEMVHPEDRQLVADRHRRRMAGQNVPDRYSLRAINRAGETLWFELNVVLIAWQQRPASLNFVHDVTRTKHLEAQLIQSQKLEAIGTLAGGIAHDFNNILAAILGYAEISLADVQDRPALSQRIGRIVEAAERARDLIARILAFSRQQAEEVRPVKVAAVVGEALRLIQASAPASVQIVSRIQDESGTVMGDATQIHQIVMNLCTNAVHALDQDGGRLEIQLDAVHLDAEAAGRYLKLASGDYLRLMVTDNGCGMDPQTLSRIFDPYFTTKTSGHGTGLGLAMVHGIVQRMAGAIKAYSEQDQGTSFQVYFPKADSDAGHLDRPPQPPPAGGNESILLIDDEPVVLEMTAETLRTLGYRVESRSSAIEALHAFHAKPGHFDLVITDLSMPRMSGKQLTQQLRAIRPDLPVILCTGFGGRTNAADEAADGIRAVLLKPILRRDLAAAVRRVLDQANGHPGQGPFSRALP